MSNNCNDVEKITLQVTKEEKNLLTIIRNIEFGEIRAVVNNGKLNRVEEIKKSIKL